MYSSWPPPSKDVKTCEQSTRSRTDDEKQRVAKIKQYEAETITLKDGNRASERGAAVGKKAVVKELYDHKDAKLLEFTKSTPVSLFALAFEEDFLELKEATSVMFNQCGVPALDGGAREAGAEFRE
ncbi:hypothetical protein C8R44DRAFT_726523 [Mycena epipterygia]|nr:hypothetical protein C8R44DRAFT_726523 [Mycena epipterygia]